MFKTQYTRTPDKPEKLSQEKLVETAGYITAKQRIESMFMAGQRLQEARKGQYDSDHLRDDENIEDFYDPTRDPGYDLSDAAVQAMEVQQRLQEKISQPTDTPSENPKPTKKLEEETKTSEE